MTNQSITRACKIITVVTPSYNQGRYIDKTIESVLTQEGAFFIDYIVVDGLSSDESPRIIEHYEKLLAENCQVTNFTWAGENRIFVKPTEGFPFHRCKGIIYRWVSEADNGQVEAIKKGFRKAIGDIYCWCNSDDIYVDNQVFTRVQRLFSADSSLDIVTGDGPIIDVNGQSIGLHHVDAINFKELLYLDYHILQPSTFFRRRIYKEEDLREKYICAFDADFFIGLIRGGARYVKTNDIYGAFRFYPEIKTLSLNKKRYVESLEIAWSHSKNVYFLLVSMFYRYFEIVLRPKFRGKSRWIDWCFLQFRKIAYLLITGRTDR